MLGLEAAPVKRLGAGGTFADVLRRPIAVLAAVPVCGDAPEIRRFLIQRTLRRAAVDAALGKLCLDTARAVAAFGALTHPGGGKTSVGLQPSRSQRVQCRGDGVVRIAAFAEFALELAPRVLALRQQPDRRLTDFGRPTLGPCVLVVAPVQPTPSSSAAGASSSAEAFFGIIRARSLRSISAAMSGFSFRNWRTFSLPCPIRSSP